MSERRATLVHNEKAGDKRHDRAALVQLLERGGYTVSYFAAKECDCAEALGEPAEVLVSAGGDGMVARVVAHARSVTVFVGKRPAAQRLNTSTNLPTMNLTKLEDAPVVRTRQIPSTDPVGVTLGLPKAAAQLGDGASDARKMMAKSP